MTSHSWSKDTTVRLHVSPSMKYTVTESTTLGECVSLDPAEMSREAIEHALDRRRLPWRARVAVAILSLLSPSDWGGRGWTIG